MIKKLINIFNPSKLIFVNFDWFKWGWNLLVKPLILFVNLNFCFILAAPAALESSTAPATEKKEEKKKEESENESDDDMGFGKC